MTRRHAIQECPLRQEIQIHSTCEICLVLAPCEHKEALNTKTQLEYLKGFLYASFIFSARQSVLANLIPSS